MSGPSPTRLPAAPFFLALIVSAVLVLSAPFVGQLRSSLQRAFPGEYVTLVGGAVAVGLAVALLAALVSIRDRRLARYGAIALAIAIAFAYSVYRAGPNPESNAVERFHFLQYGLITFLFYRSWRPLGDLSILVMPGLAGVIVGSIEEWFQWFIPNRVGEMSDVFLNLVAISTGLLFSVAAHPPPAFRLSFGAHTSRKVLRLAGVSILTFAAFVHAVHLGHRIDDDEIGVFESRYSNAQLVALQAERADRWRATPPPTRLVRLSREDQYLTEGILHVRERNRTWSAGDFRASWLENKILEKYYEPVLDTPTHEGAGHRWPDGQRADAEARGSEAPPDPLVSGAYPYPVLTWHPLWYWVTVIVLVAVLEALARRTPRHATESPMPRATVRSAD